MTDIRHRCTALLGSEGLAGSLPGLMHDLGGEGEVALISAGLQDQEGVPESLQEVLGRPVVDLRLYQRAAEVFDADSRLAAAARTRSQQMRQLQEDYRIRLSHAASAALSLQRATGEVGPEGMTPEGRHLDDALGALRELDEHHLDYLGDVHAEPLPGSDELDRVRQVLHEQLARCDTVLIAGGHVAVLRNRIRTFSLDAHLLDKHLVGWGAGAMVLCERVVLFLDHAPRGPRQPEVLDSGIGAAGAVVAIPAALRRLATQAHPRMALTARRFAPSRCIGLHEAADVRFLGERMTQARAAITLEPGGDLVEVSVP